MPQRRKTDPHITPKILIVDDDSRNLFALREALEDLNCQLVEAASGQEALALTLEEDFALILLDVQMPNMDGFEVASLLKKSKKTKDMPIIFLTAFSKEQKHVQHGHMVGAVDYMFKPIDPVILSSKVAVYLEYYMQKLIYKAQLDNLNKIHEDLSQSNIQLEKLAKHDALTGLANRYSFEEILLSSIDLAKRNDLLMSVMYLDLDNFKDVNDTFGHDVGDELLKMVSFRIREVIRSTDYFTKHASDCTVSRLGGDEFSIILFDVPRPETAGIIASRMIKAFEESFIINDHSLDIGLSIGIANYPAMGETADSLCKHADEAMYVSKRAGKHSYHFYSDELQESYEDNLKLQSTMKQSLTDEEFYLYYQPIIDLKTNKIIGVETLCRLNHSQLGQVSPEKFITVAEESNLTKELGLWILTKAAIDIQSIKDTVGDDFLLCINVSMGQFNDHDFVTDIKNVFAQHHVDFHNIEFEITESILSHNSKNAEESIRELHKLGASISIDDFGTGYSSLKRLREMPISTLKIDRSFMKEIDSDKGDSNLILSLLDLARNLNLHVIAEGIETERQRRFLAEHHCDYGQGFLMSKPLPLAELVKFIERQ